MKKFLWVLWGFLGLFFVLYVFGLRLNISGSVPEGIYCTEKKTVAVGDYVMFCPPLNKPSVFTMAMTRGYIDSGFCPGGYGHLIKMVAAKEGDTVMMNSAGVWVNGKRLPYSRPLLLDGAGRLLPQLHLASSVLKPHEFLLMTNQSALSFDARYFGVLTLKDQDDKTLTVLRALWVR